MPDFAKALEEGFEAARRAEVARHEIDQIFDELSKQLLKATDGKVKISRTQYEVEETGWAITPFAFPPKPKDHYWAIAALNPTIGRKSQVQLARWVPGEGGYPCTVAWHKQENICQDGASLATCLAEMLSDPIVGQKLRSLTKLEPEKADQ